MKKILISLALIIGLYSTGFCFSETVDIFCSSITVKTVSISSSATTSIVSSAEIWISTTVTGNSAVAWRAVFYNIRNDAASDIDIYITPDQNRVLTEWFNIRQDEVYRETSPLPRWGRLSAGRSGTVTVRVEIGYIRR